MPTTSLPPEIIEAQRQLNEWYSEWVRDGEVQRLPRTATEVAFDTPSRWMPSDLNVVMSPIYQPLPLQPQPISRARMPQREYATTSARKAAERTTKDGYDLD